ncbi:hypothetical protein ACQ4PT_040060 [Festuca glaucescens]
MFWRMTGLSAASPVSPFCSFSTLRPALSLRLAQVEQLLRYVVEEVPDDAEKKRSFKFPFIACEIFTCEIDVILRTLVEDEELMDLLFSFVKPDHPHSTLLSGYFSKEHPEIVVQLVDLIGITSVMEVLIRLIGADETIYSNYADTMQCFVGRLFCHALEGSRPKSVLVHSLSVCISLLDPKRLASASYQAFRSNVSHGALVTASPETVDGMLESLGNLLNLLDTSAADNVLPTTYGCLRPPLGKHRLKIVEFISVLLTVGSETAEKELISQSAIKRSIDLFFEYPYNNFLHHHVENIIVSCLEGKRIELVEHVLNECDIVGKILAADKLSSLSTESNGPTVPSEGKTPSKIGNVGHMTRIANKLIQLGNSNSTIQTHLQDNSEWVEWQTDVLVRRNEVENVYHWACGRPTSLHDRGRDSDDDDFRDRDYDVAALANNLSQAFRYGIYSNDDIEEAQGSLERDDEDVYFDDESAEVVISSLRLGDEPDGSSLFTNSNWFTFDGERGINDRLAASVPSSSPNSEEASPDTEEADDGQVIGTEDQMETLSLGNGPTEEAEDAAECIKQTNLNTEDEQLESAEGIERHPDASNGDTEVSTDEAASAVAESSAPATEMQAEGTVDKPAGSSDLDNPVSEASPDTDANGNDMADSAVSPEQAIPNEEVELPMKTDAAVDAQMKTDAVADVKPETDAVVDVGAKTDAVVDLPSKEVSAVDVGAKTGTVEANE